MGRDSRAEELAVSASFVWTRAGSCGIRIQEQSGQSRPNVRRTHSRDFAKAAEAHGNTGGAVVAVFGWGIAIIELVIIFVLIRAMEQERAAKEACMKWTARYMIEQKRRER